MNQASKRIFDFFIQTFIILGFLYAGYQLVFVFKNPEGTLVLFNDASKINSELLLARRLYAIEFWIIFTCHIVYLGLRKRIWSFS